MLTSVRIGCVLGVVLASIAGCNKSASTSSVPTLETRKHTVNAGEAPQKQGESGPTTPVAITAEESAQRANSANNLKQIGQAMHDFHDANKPQSFPPAVVVGPDGKTTHSLRVALLPFLGEKDLYKAYKLDEPWDSENNKKVLARIPKVYQADPGSGSTNSSYFVFTGKETVFAGKYGMRITDIIDGTSNTILAVEAKHDVPWTKPEDLPYDPVKPLPKVGGYFPGGFHAVFADCSKVRFLPENLTEESLRALITRAGRERVPRF